MSDTVEVIKQIVVGLKRSPELTAQLHDRTNLIDEVRLDSLELLQLMLELEDKLAIQIDFEALEFSHLHSIERLAGFLDSMPPLPKAGGA